LIEGLVVIGRNEASVKADNLLNLSILLSRGKERKIDSPSIGEKRGKSPNLKSLEFIPKNCSLIGMI
jgi:hypothetical protein